MFKGDGSYTNENGTKPSAGYGLPSKGSYSLARGGFKTFGTQGQGNDTDGLKEANSSSCTPRMILVTVTALRDFT